jgi:2-amino-4-hydroxy-6-hydroxymethyldihydropteridine diphosphokinase
MANAKNHIAYLGIGANLGSPINAVRDAIERLETVSMSVDRVAKLYRSPPLGPADQPDYINTVVRLRTSHSPEALLLACQAIELALGRKKAIRWGPRVIDLDILLYDDLQLICANLVIPHPEMHKRRFVLKPLCDLVPEFTIPGFQSTIRELEAALEVAPAIHQIA